MTRRPDEEQRLRDEREAERDAGRELRSPVRARRDLTGRDALRLKLAERGAAVEDESRVPEPTPTEGLTHADHDPGDEDRTPAGPWCSRCGDAFDGPERDCPNPAPGRPYCECGRGGHMFDLDRPMPAADASDHVITEAEVAETLAVGARERRLAERTIRRSPSGGRR